MLEEEPEKVEQVKEVVKKESLKDEFDMLENKSEGV